MPETALKLSLTSFLLCFLFPLRALAAELEGGGGGLERRKFVGDFEPTRVFRRRVSARRGSTRFPYNGTTQSNCPTQRSNNALTVASVLSFSLLRAPIWTSPPVQQMRTTHPVQSEGDTACGRLLQWVSVILYPPCLVKYSHAYFVNVPFTIPNVIVRSVGLNAWTCLACIWPSMRSSARVCAS